jgi:hypothetical protein
VIVFAHFELPDIAEVSRRTVAAALIVGVASLVAAFSFGYLLVGVGACIGLGMGTINYRLVGVSVDKVTALGVENPKRPLAVNTLGRMGIITVIALGLTFLNKSLGFGVLGGLAVFQVLLIFNVARSMAKAGPMPGTDDGMDDSVLDHSRVVERNGPLERNGPVERNGPLEMPAVVESADDARGGA